MKPKKKATSNECKIIKDVDATLIYTSALRSAGTVCGGLRCVSDSIKDISWFNEYL